MSCPCRMNLTSKCSSPRTNVQVSIYTIWKLVHSHLIKFSIDTFKNTKKFVETHFGHLSDIFPFELDHESGTTCIQARRKVRVILGDLGAVSGAEDKVKTGGKKFDVQKEFFPARFDCLPPH